MTGIRLKDSIGGDQIPLRCSHNLSSQLGLREPETFQELQVMFRSQMEAVDRYFQRLVPMSVRDSKDYMDANTICVDHDSVEDIKKCEGTLTEMYSEDAVKLAIEHYNLCGITEVKILQSAIDVEISEEQREMNAQLFSPELMAQMEASKGGANNII